MGRRKHMLGEKLVNYFERQAGVALSETDKKVLECVAYGIPFDEELVEERNDTLLHPKSKEEVVKRIQLLKAQLNA